jgi:OOP family OmpA-OmpF porin
MNYSTIKKAVTCSLIAALGFTGAAQAQDAKVFGGRSQYRTWSIGINGGITSPNVLVGGSNAFGNKVGLFEAPVREYYGINVRKQFSSWFGLQLDANRGRIFTHNAVSTPPRGVRGSRLDHRVDRPDVEGRTQDCRS